MTNLSEKLHAEIVETLRAENVVDLGTLPTAHEREDLKTRVAQLFTTKYVNTTPEVKKRIFQELFDCGPLHELLLDQQITEIVVNGPRTIWFEKFGQMHRHTENFFSSVSYQNFLHRLSSEARIQANLDRPYADGYWRQYRVHLIIPPLAQGGAHLTLRRHPDSPWTLHRLEEVGWAPPDALQCLKSMIQNHTSLLIVGATGTGKTSVLSACLQEVPSTERIVTIEDTNEIHSPNELSTKLLSRHDSQGVLQDVDLATLLRQALRMRPDRIIMGEVRGDEAKDLLMALSTGHRGGMATLHADNARQALYRLEMLIQMGAPQWSTRAIRHLIYFGLQAIVCVKRVNGERRLDAIHKITSLEDSGFCLERMAVTQA